MPIAAVTQSTDGKVRELAPELYGVEQNSTVRHSVEQVYGVTARIKPEAERESWRAVRNVVVDYKRRARRQKCVGWKCRLVRIIPVVAQTQSAEIYCRRPVIKQFSRIGESSAVIERGHVLGQHFIQPHRWHTGVHDPRADRRVA